MYLYTSIINIAFIRVAPTLKDWVGLTTHFFIFPSTSILRLAHFAMLTIRPQADKQRFRPSKISWRPIGVDATQTRSSANPNEFTLVSLFSRKPIASSTSESASSIMQLNRVGWGKMPYLTKKYHNFLQLNVELIAIRLIIAEFNILLIQYKIKHKIYVLKGPFTK